MRQVALLLKEIYDELCPECKEKLAELVSRRISKEQIKRLLDAKDKGREGE